MKAYKITTEKSWTQTQRELENEFSKWDISEWKTNYPKGARFEGRGEQELADRTVTLAYEKDGKHIQLSMGTQKRAIDNLRVLYLAINSMRLNEARGIGDVVKSHYLQISAGVVDMDPYEVLQVLRTTPLIAIQAVYRSLVKQCHPDGKTADVEQYKRLTRAMELIRLEKQNNA